MASRRMIHIVDDEEAIRRSAGFMLRTSGYAVTSFASGPDFLQATRSLEAGCVLLDVRMPDMDGLEVQRELALRGVAMPVVILTGHGDISIAVRAMRAGAVDFIEKPFEKSVFLEAIVIAFERLDDSTGRATRARDAAVAVACLTAREQDVLRGLAQGMPNKTIAFDLGISPRTVEVHRANLMAKLQVSSLSEALRIAFATGLQNPP
ncbi:MULTISPECIES: response regulator transcription factor [unclassified Caulobacter]|uniref:response regulator transcription factor n=1 Tax=unclassified Caulobacter TaxID=2648921 RepID=UPI000D3C9E0C|nr:MULTISPECIES: response regulator [unclassified Caulobacter]PTS83254.1 DNA-binding response regulator [Caulobacter sp. HMWF009]PTT06681.1 DNA-binding response regulator [Caulobacter sp. HMWF025]PTT84885.1 DNA-binding response regulator [Pseudomonas sp. HMWF010]